MQAKLTNAKALDEITLDTILERVGGDKFVKKNSNKNKEQTCPWWIRGRHIFGQFLGFNMLSQMLEV